MLDLLIRILLAPLLIAQAISDNLDPSSPYFLLLTVFSLSLILALLIVRLSLSTNDRLKKVFADKIGTEYWPPFVRGAYFALCGAFEVGLLGVIANSLVRVVNTGQTPVFKISGGLSAGSAYVNEASRLVWLCNYISIGSSKLLQLLYPPRIIWLDGDRFSIIIADYCTPGDLAISASIVLSWWIALAVVVWAVLYAVKDVRKKRLQRFK